MRRIGILYHPKLSDGPSLAREIQQLLHSEGPSTWISSAWEEEQATAQAQGTDLVVSIGGDGTILRAARIVLPYSIPIVGVNMGRLGFMTELLVTEVRDKLPALVRGEGWLDERTMLEAELKRSVEMGDEQRQVLFALNDVVVGRGSRARVVYVEVIIDGQLFTVYKVDSVVLATATGSTGYSMAAGGPILHPQSREFILQPVAPHLSLSCSIVLLPDSSVEFQISNANPALLSIDGQVDYALHSGDKVVIKRSSRLTRFLRLTPPTAFYGSLEKKLKGNRRN